MANKWRGEIKAKVAGKAHKLKLRFQEIVEIEAQLGKGIFEIAKQFADGKYSAKSVVILLTYGLQGAGHLVDEAELGDKVINNGLAEHVSICVELLSKTLSPLESEDL